MVLFFGLVMGAGRTDALSIWNRPSSEGSMTSTLSAGSSSTSIIVSGSISSTWSNSAFSCNSLSQVSRVSKNSAIVMIRFLIIDQLWCLYDCFNAGTRSVSFLQLAIGNFSWCQMGANTSIFTGRWLQNLWSRIDCIATSQPRCFLCKKYAPQESSIRVPLMTGRNCDLNCSNCRLMLIVAFLI